MYASKHFDFKKSMHNLLFPVLVSFLHHRNYVCPGSTPILTSDIQLALAKKLAKAIQNYC